MKRLIIAMAVSAAFASVVVTSQSSTEVERHVAAAKLAAGTDHVGLFDRICAEAQQIAPPRPRRTGPRPTPPRESWHAEPVQVFDNLYFLGMTEYSAWAVTTSDGIILIDAHDPGRVHRPEIDTQSDTLRSGRPCDSWTPLEAKVRDSLSKNAPLDAIGRCRNGGNRPFNQGVAGSIPARPTNKYRGLYR